MTEGNKSVGKGVGRVRQTLTYCTGGRGAPHPLVTGGLRPVVEIEAIAFGDDEVHSELLARRHRTLSLFLLVPILVASATYIVLTVSRAHVYPPCEAVYLNNSRSQVEGS